LASEVRIRPQILFPVGTSVFDAVFQTGVQSRSLMDDWITECRTGKWQLAGVESDLDAKLGDVRCFELKH
jgi:hypothetical protein